MIQVFTVTAPLGERDPDGATATLQAAADKLTRLYPHLRGAAVQASEGVLTLTIRVAAMDRWRCSSTARKIGTNMLVRVGIPAGAGHLELVQTLPSARMLTKTQGRSGSPGRQPVGSDTQAPQELS